MYKNAGSVVVLFLLVCASGAAAQVVIVPQPPGPNGDPQGQHPATSEAKAPPSDAGGQSKTQEPEASPAGDQKKDDSEGKQTKRMFWVVPNFAAVSAHTQLPPLSTREKYIIAMHDSVDYSSFVWAGIIAGQSMALNSDPELHGGIAGYGRYYWRGFVDQASGAVFTEAFVPSLTHEDPRYYTLGSGGFFRRMGYALTQTVVTKTDAGGRSFNISEVLGNGLEAGLSNLYYPPEERGLSKTARNWGTQMESAALNNIVKEFWPDIRRKLFRQK